MQQPKHPLLRRIMLRAAKLPLIYFVTGLTLIALAYIDDIFPLTQWKNIFDMTDKLGEFFISLSGLTFIYNFFVYACLRYEQKFTGNHTIASLVVSSIRKGSRVIFILIAINVFISIAAPAKTELMAANKIIHAIIIGSISWVIIQILYTIEAVIHQYMRTLAHEEQVRVNEIYTKVRILRNISSVVIIVIAIASILMSFDSVKNIGISLLASAGFLTAIIGLSAQKTLFSLFSGLQIAISQPIKIGDIVVIEKESGMVEEITFTYVTLKLGDRRRLVVPINYFVERPFENWSRDANSLRSSLHLHVDHMMPIEPLRQELDNILLTSPHWDGAAKKLQVANLNGNSVEIRIQVSAANADKLSDLRAEVREKILLFMQTHYPTYFPNIRHVDVIPSEFEKFLQPQS